MAVLERIRSRMGILISLIIGLSLLAFILTDFLGSGKSVLRGNSQEIAEIAGEEVNFPEFDEKINKLTDVYKFQSGQKTLTDEALQSIREQVWQQIVEEKVLGNEYKELGIEVTAKELLDMVQGANPHQYVKQLFTNPETGMYNRTAVAQFIGSLDKEQNGDKKNFWMYIENMILRERTMNKYMSLIKKGLYVTSQQVKAEMSDNSKKVTFAYVGERFAAIADSSVAVKESDLKKYLSKHSKEFEQEASRDIEYITYEIVPSPEDFQATQKSIYELLDEFKTTAEIKQFVNLNSDNSFNEKFLHQNELADSLKFLFNAKVGDSYGPYFENNTFKLARLVEVKNMSDSVKARHILLRPAAQTKEAYEKSKLQADSLKSVLKKGGNFADLAKKFSSDGSASKGGDLGWFKEGAMVKPFNDACFAGKKGDIVVVESQFGIHVIEITEKGKESKKVQIALLDKKVDASSATEQAIYQKASSFAGNNNTGDKFVSGVKKEGLILQPANRLNENMREVQGVTGSRELIRWAFKAKQNEISGVMEFGSKFVIARLSQVREKGVSELEQVKDQLLVLVRKDLKTNQLSEKISNELKNASSLSDLAVKLNSKVDTARDVNFAGFAIPSLGFEPAVIGAATTLSPDKLSAPVKGNNGVYVISVISSSTQEVNEESLKSRLTGMNANKTYEALNTLKKLADIKDERSKFY